MTRTQRAGWRCAPGRNCGDGLAFSLREGRITTPVWSTSLRTREKSLSVQPSSNQHTINKVHVECTSVCLSVCRCQPGIHQWDCYKDVSQPPSIYASRLEDWLPSQSAEQVTALISAREHIVLSRRDQTAERARESASKLPTASWECSSVHVL